MGVAYLFFSYPQRPSRDLQPRVGLFGRLHPGIPAAIFFMKDGAELVWPMDSSITKLDSTQIDSVQVRPVIRERAVTHVETNLPYHLSQQHSAPLSGKLVETYGALGAALFTSID